MARRKSKINYSGSLADYKISMMVAQTNDSQLVDGGGSSSAGQIFGEGASTTTDYMGQQSVPGLGKTEKQFMPGKFQKPPDRYPNPGRTPQKPVDRYPNPKVPAQLPARPVDRYPEATPAQIPARPRKPKKPKKPKTKGGGGDSTTGVS